MNFSESFEREPTARPAGFPLCPFLPRRPKVVFQFTAPAWSDLVIAIAFQLAVSNKRVSVFANTQHAGGFGSWHKIKIQCVLAHRVLVHCFPLETVP